MVTVASPHQGRDHHAVILPAAARGLEPGLIILPVVAGQLPTPLLLVPRFTIQTHLLVILLPVDAAQAGLIMLLVHASSPPRKAAIMSQHQVAAAAGIGILLPVLVVRVQQAADGLLGELPQAAPPRVPVPQALIG